MIIKKIIKRIITLISSYPKINQNGKGIIGFIDVGSIGLLPSPWFENANTIFHLLKFEPQEQSTHEPNVTSYNKALWSKDEIKDFYIYEGFEGTGSSLFLQNVEFVKSNFKKLRLRGPKKLAESWIERSKLIKTEKIECKKLDTILENLDCDFDFLKIDAQGAEYQILKGAEKFLKKSCLGLHLELFTIPLYKEIKLLSEVEEYLLTLGFKLKRKIPPHGTFDSQHDCIFLREDVEEKDRHKIQLIEKLYNIKG